MNTTRPDVSDTRWERVWGVKFFFNEPVEGLKFSPNGKYLAAGTEGQLFFVNIETKEKFQVLPEDPI